MITRKKFGLLTLVLGVLLLFIGILILCISDSIWAVILMGVSILINTFGVSVLVTKDQD